MPAVGSSSDSGIVAPGTAGLWTYWRPQSPNFKAVDSILLHPDGSIIMFQMTVSKERQVNIEHIKELLAQLPPLQPVCSLPQEAATRATPQLQPNPQLYIVVPKDVFEELKVVPSKAPADSSAGAGGRSLKRALDVSVFALLGSATPAQQLPSKRPHDEFMTG